MVPLCSAYAFAIVFLRTLMFPFDPPMLFLWFPCSSYGPLDAFRMVPLSLRFVFPGGGMVLYTRRRDFRLGGHLRLPPGRAGRPADQPVGQAARRNTAQHMKLLFGPGQETLGNLN